LEERLNIVKFLGLPETFAVLLLTFCFVLVLAPYFSGADFGLFKIPKFTSSARKRLKIIGPICFLALVLLFVPTITRQNVTKPIDASQNNSQSVLMETNSNSSPPGDVQNRIQQHLLRAREFYSRAEYKEAIDECDKALDLAAENQEAQRLKASINNTREILDRNQ
jgi:hypothetical protein